MAKTSGLGATLTVADSGGTPRAISNDVTDFTLNTPINLQDTTGVNKSAHERLAQGGVRGKLVLEVSPR